jgi:hypothetical protein
MSFEIEKQTIAQMIRLFCKAKHGTKDSLCEECSELLGYAHARLDHCPFGDDKPVCRKCTAHYYKPEMRRRVTEVMRFAGPRMLTKNPGSAIRHLLHSLK